MKTIYVKRLYKKSLTKAEIAKEADIVQFTELYRHLNSPISDVLDELKRRQDDEEDAELNALIYGYILGKRAERAKRKEKHNVNGSG